MDGRGLDEVAHCLSLSEIEAARKEGSLSKFAGFGKPGPGAKAFADKQIEKNRGTVGGDFYDVFRGIRVGSFIEGDHGLVECFSGPVHNLSEAGLAGS